MAINKKVNELLYDLNEIVCQTFSVCPGFMANATRKEPYPIARFSVFWCLNKLGFSPAEISRKTGFSRPPVVHGIQKFTDLLICDDERCKAIERWFRAQKG